MNPDQVNPEYEPLKIQKLRDSIEGSTAIKAKGEDYIIRPSAMDGVQYADEFAAYISRADYLPVVSRTLYGLQGRAFSKEPMIEGEFVVDPANRPFQRFLRDAFREVLSVGYMGLLADVRDGEGKLYQYVAEDIEDWHYEEDKLVYLKLNETKSVFDRATYERQIVTQYRTYSIDDDGFAYSELWEMEKNEAILVDGPTYPTSPSGRIEFIPFVFVGDADGKPPLMDLAELALQYYDASAQFHWALSKVASPTFVITWDKDTDFNDALEFMEMTGASGGIKIGSGHALQLKGADAKFVEVQGAGLDKLAGRLETLKSQMIAAGARALSDQVASNVAAETARIANSGEAAYLSEIVGGFEADMQVAFDYAAAIDGSDPIQLTMNRDFFSEVVTPQDLVALVSAWQSGGIPQEVVFEALRKGDWSDLEDDELRDRVDGVGGFNL